MEARVGLSSPFFGGDGVFRAKTIFGERVRARSFGGQAAQLLVRCAALNRMTHLGMPDGYRVAA